VSIAYKLVAVVGEVSNLFDRFPLEGFRLWPYPIRSCKTCWHGKAKEIAEFLFLPFIFWMEEISWAHLNKVPNVLGQSRLGLQQINELSFRFFWKFWSTRLLSTNVIFKHTHTLVSYSTRALLQVINFFYMKMIQSLYNHLIK